jgi:putative transcriptional regulator
MSRLRALLIGSVTDDRYAPFLHRLAALTDLSSVEVQAILRRIKDLWEESPWAGCELIHLQGGPATVGADTGLVRLQPGCRFPLHRHPSEHVLILQGALQEAADGTEGSIIRKAGDQFSLTGAHTFTALPGEPLIYAVVVYDVEFLE